MFRAINFVDIHAPGILPSPSLMAVNSAVTPSVVKRIFAFRPPSSPASRVSEAAIPIGKGNFLSSIKYFLTRAVKITPRIVPARVTINRVVKLTSACLSSIQIPGMVNASPPATMDPADIAVCVTLISFKFVFFIAFNIAMDITATKIVGHGRAPIRRATYMELVVIITAPMAPTIILRTVSCSL